MPRSKKALRKGEPLPKPKSHVQAISNGLVTGRWCVARSRRAKRHVHVYPTLDLTAHTLEPDCWCKPACRREGDGLMFTHNSADGRELIEQHGIN